MVTTTPVILYSASGTPIGPAGYGIRALIQFYRPTASADSAGLVNIANAGPAFGSESTGTAVGSPIAISDLGLDFNSSTHMTTGRFTESNNDPTIMRGTPTLNCGTFIQSATQPTLMPGDYCNLSIGIMSNAAAAPASRWVVDNDSIGTAGNNKFTLKLALDRVNSSPNLDLF